MTDETYLIVNADDFGYCPGVNRGIVDAHERGIVTSASLIVREPDATEAARYAREKKSLALGIHIDLGEWSYEGGNWVPRYQRVVLEDPVAVEREVWEQISVFRDLVGRDPTHIDSHQNVHVREPARGVVTRQGRALGIPIRHFGPDVRYCGAFYGQTAEGDPLPERISTEALVALLLVLQPGITELGCHPGYSGDRVSIYARERDAEVRTLCDPAIRECLELSQVRLVSFDTMSRIRG